VVYVLAAYSITFGVLTIYGVMLQHAARIAHVRLASGSAGEGVDLGRGFNLGAALLAPIWAWFHGLRAVGAALLLTAVLLAWLCSSGAASGPRWPATSLAAILAAAALYLGVYGNRIAVRDPASTDPAEFFSRQLRWALAGAALHTVVLPWACYFLIARA